MYLFQCLRRAVVVPLLPIMELSFPRMLNGMDVSALVVIGKQCQLCHDTAPVLVTPKGFKRCLIYDGSGRHYGNKALCVKCWQPIMPFLDSSEQPVSMGGHTTDVPVDHALAATPPGAQLAPTSPTSELIKEILREGLPVKNLCAWTTKCLRSSTECLACQELWSLCLQKAQGRVAKKKMTPMLREAWEDLRLRHFPRVGVQIPPPSILETHQDNDQSPQHSQPHSSQWETCKFMNRYIQKHSEVTLPEIAENKDKKGIGCATSSSCMRWGDIQFQHGGVLKRSIDRISVMQAGKEIEIPDHDVPDDCLPFIRPWSSSCKRSRH